MTLKRIPELREYINKKHEYLDRIETGIRETHRIEQEIIPYLRAAKRYELETGSHPEYDKCSVHLSVYDDSLSEITEVAEAYGWDSINISWANGEYHGRYQSQFRGRDI